MSSSPDRLSRSLVFATDLLEQLRDLTAYAEGAGFDRVFTTDFPGRDALTRALYLGLRSSTIGVGTGIAYAFTRSPRALAAAAADIQRLSTGRFVLGLGTGTRGVRRWYGTEFDPPATRLAALVGELRGYWQELPELEALGPPQTAGAGINVAMLRTVARVCDRVLLHPLCLVDRHLDDRVLPAVAAGAAKRTEGSVAISAWAIASVDPDSDVARARVRRQTAFYMTTPSYGTVFEGTQFTAAAERIREEFLTMKSAPDWDALARLVPDELLPQISLAGTDVEVREQTAAMERRLAARGVDELVLQTTQTEPDAQELIASTRQILCALARPKHWSKRGETIRYSRESQ